MTMKIGILGSGNMGSALGGLWAEQGHDVHFGGRDPEKVAVVARRVGRGSLSGTLVEAVDFGDVLVHSARHALPSSMARDLRVLDGKVLIDLNNMPMPDNFAFEPGETSFAETYQRDVPGLRVVKAFNTVPVQVFDYCPERVRAHDVSIFVAGDDSDAKAIVMRLAADIGFRPVDAGALRNARLLETFGDMLRYLINGAGLGACTTISARALPYPLE